MSLMMMTQAFKVKVGNPARKLVLVKLADNANDQGECWPSYGHIARECEMGRSTVKAHIKALAEAGFLHVQYRRRGDTNSSNIYKLTLEEGKPIERTKPSRPGKAKLDMTIDPGQPLTYLPRSAVDPTRSRLDPPGSAVDLPPGQPLTPEPVIKNQSVNQSKNPMRATTLRDGFEIFYNAGLPKKSRPKAEVAFKTQANKHGDPIAFAKMIAENIKGRLGTDELGFDAMYPATYLNGQRWLDEVSVSAAADPSTPTCPHAEILAAWDEHLGARKGRAPAPVDWQGTRMAAKLEALWVKNWNATNPSGAVRYSTTEEGISWWSRVFKHLAATQNFLQSDVTLSNVFNPDTFALAVKGNLRSQGGATR